MGHGLRRAAAQHGGSRFDSDVADRYDAKGYKDRGKHSKQVKQVKHGQQPYGFPDMTAWMNQHPGSTEWSCEFCGIYTASKPRCNQCECG